jgi:hypothetical protein
VIGDPKEGRSGKTSWLRAGFIALGGAGDGSWRARLGLSSKPLPLSTKEAGVGVKAMPPGILSPPFFRDDFFGVLWSFSLG